MKFRILVELTGIVQDVPCCKSFSLPTSRERARFWNLAQVHLGVVPSQVLSNVGYIVAQVYLSCEEQQTSAKRSHVRSVQFDRSP